MLEDWQKQRQKYIFSKPCLSCLKTKCRPIWSPFLDQGPNGKGVKIRKLIEDKIRRKKLKNHVFFCTAIPIFLSFYMQCPVWFPCFSCWIGELQTTFLLPHSKETAGASWSQLWKERKELYHPLINGN